MYLYLITMMPETENQRVVYSRALRASRFWLVAGFLFFSLSGFAQTRSFIQKYRPLADSLSVEYGIPTSVILSISILESASGTSRNCRLLNNFFGIVGKNNLLKTRGIKSRYKQYENDTASFVGFCKLQTKKKYYQKLITIKTTEGTVWTSLGLMLLHIIKAMINT